MARHPRQRVAAALILDAALVVVFAVIGRASHHEDVWTGLWGTAWPFLLALVVGWVAVVAWRAPLAPLRTGLPVWAVTVAGGILLRALTGQGTDPAFVIVAAVVLLVMLVGWRTVVAVVSRVRRRRGTPHTGLR